MLDMQGQPWKSEVLVQSLKYTIPLRNFNPAKKSFISFQSLCITKIVIILLHAVMQISLLKYTSFKKVT